MNHNIADNKMKLLNTTEIEQYPMTYDTTGTAEIIKYKRLSPKDSPRPRDVRATPIKCLRNGTSRLDEAGRGYRTCPIVVHLQIIER